MGSFYANFTAFGIGASRVADILKGLQRDAFVASSVGDFTVFYDREADEQVEAAIVLVGSQVSQTCNCPVLAVLNHDDDILCYWLFKAGEQITFYNSNPGYFDDGDRTPIGVDAEALCEAFQRSDEETIDEVDAILSEEEDYVFALDRHQALSDWLGLPWEYVCIGYNYIKSGNLMEGVNQENFQRVE